MKNVFIAMVFVLSVTATLSMAQNPVPYTDTYEDYASGSNLIGSVWQGDTNSVTAIATNLTYPAPGMGYPTNAPSHTNVMAFGGGTISNEFNASSFTLVALDTMIKPVFAEPPLGDQMVAVSNSQVSMYIGTNQLVNIWHGTGDGWALPGAIQWSEFAQMTISTSDWIRVTMTFNYLYDEFDTGARVAMFKTAINGVALTNSLGKSVANPAMAPDGGPWFKAGLWTETELDCKFHRVVLSGSGLVDDMVITTNEIAFNPPVGPAYATNGTAIAWMQQQGLNTNGVNTWDDVALADDDGDGIPNWSEYYAGTQPTNAASKLMIVSLTYSNGLPHLKWIGSSNALAPYAVQWSSNLMSILNWTPATNNLPNTQGTNEAPLPLPVSNPGFLQVIVDTNAP